MRTCSSHMHSSGTVVMELAGTSCSPEIVFGGSYVIAVIKSRILGKAGGRCG